MADRCLNPHAEGRFWGRALRRTCVRETDPCVSILLTVESVIEGVRSFCGIDMFGSIVPSTAVGEALRVFLLMPVSAFLRFICYFQTITSGQNEMSRFLHRSTLSPAEPQSNFLRNVFAN